MKKVLALVVALLMVLMVFAACGKADAPAADKPAADAPAADEPAADEPAADEPAEVSNVKVGFIFLHDENSTYDKNFIDAANAAVAALGLSADQVVMKSNIPESNDCYEAAADLADSGCNLVFANSFGHEQYMIQAAKEFPEVQFCHATGTMAHTAGLDNFHNAFASIYEGRYLAGIAAGMKLNEMIEAGEFTEEEAKIGYVGAYTYAEVVSGYTSFFLGARSVCPTATMEVQFTGSWYDETAEKEAALTLLSNDCKLISQHADSMGAPTACETAGVPNVSYNGSTLAACPNTFIVSSRIDWQPYFELIIKAVENGEAIPADWCGGIAEGSVALTEVNEAVAAAGTVEAIEAAKKEFEAGTLKVFATDTFTVSGNALDSYMADVDTDEAYTPDTEVIADGFFHESEYRSAPYFDLQIDGITLLNQAF
ncbi:MAG: BMP family ABC transporter substrate-binding protein [Christensenellaceae bacterium]|nr:BMP family ABC transporter substrate-binding protein [Christensenellaceae bacterium]